MGKKGRYPTAGFVTYGSKLHEKTCVSENISESDFVSNGHYIDTSSFSW